ncbi:TPA: hypothetical protein DD394_02880 [bacterium UBP9_UBA11836]|nr:hypothetical protein [bacterium UBP9_UBA11836]
MARLLKWTVGSAVGLFVALFIIVPIAILWLTSFTGEPIPILEYLTKGQSSAIWQELSHNFTLQYYGELLDTKRYSQGLVNTVGLVPGFTALFLLIALAGRSLISLISVKLADKIGHFLNLNFASIVAALLTVFSLTWQNWLPESTLLWHFMHWLAPGRSGEERFLQTFGFCSSVTVVACILGTIAAFCIERVNIPGRRLFKVLSIVPLALPSFLGALAVKNILGINGVLTKALASLGWGLPFEAQSVWASGLTQIFLYFPFVLLTVSAALEYFDTSLTEAAQSMGASSFFTFLTVRFPLLMPGILSGAFLVFVRSFGDFSAISLLMPLQYPMIVVEAYRDLSGSTYWGGACMLSVLMMLTVLGILGLQKYYLSRANFEIVGGKGHKRIQRSENPWLCALAGSFCAVIFFVPLCFVIITFIVSIAGTWGIEFLPSSYTLSRYAEVWKASWAADSPLANSFMLALPGLFWSLLLATISAAFIARSNSPWRHILDFCVLLPFVVPGVVFAVALICTFNGPPLALHLTGALVVCAYILTSMPYGVRSAIASFSQISRNLEESSSTLGAPSLLTFAKVTAPLIRSGIAAGAIMIFIACMQEVAITLMTCPPQWRPLSTYIFMEIQEGNVFNASAYGIVLFLLIVIPYSLYFVFTSKQNTTMHN